MHDINVPDYLVDVHNYHSLVDYQIYDSLVLITI
jgi:hypothetical protein